MPSTLLPPDLTDLDVEGAPTWLAARRRAAAEAAAGTAPPSPDEEVWRYSRIADLDLGRFTPVMASLSPLPPLPAGSAAAVAAVGDMAGVLVVADGAVVEARLAPEAAAQGVRFGPLVGKGSAGVDGEAAAELVGVVGAEVVTGGAAGSGPGLFHLLNDALSVPLVLDVPAGVVVAAPFLVVDWSVGPDRATFPRLVVRLGADSQATVVEWHGSEDVAGLTVPATELDAGPAARLSHVLVQDRGPQVWQVGELAARAAASATVSSVQLALGGTYSRCRADCRLVGRGASGQLDAAYFGTRDQMLDFRTFQDHQAPDTTSNLLFKGAVAGTSQSVYTGLIRVAPGARGTNAYQTNRNLKLSDGAWAESVPNLEIENNDVRCSHASTVGPVDEDQRFYLESRGVPPGAADRLIVNGFFDEVLRRVGVAGVEAAVRAEVDRRLVEEAT